MDKQLIGYRPCGHDGYHRAKVFICRYDDDSENRDGYVVECAECFFEAALSMEYRPKDDPEFD